MWLCFVGWQVNIETVVADAPQWWQQTTRPSSWWDDKMGADRLRGGKSDRSVVVACLWLVKESFWRKIFGSWMFKRLVAVQLYGHFSDAVSSAVSDDFQMCCFSCGYSWFSLRAYMSMWCLSCLSVWCLTFGRNLATAFPSSAQQV